MKGVFRPLTKICSKCDKEFTKPTKWESRCFCPHCDVEIFKPRKTQKPTPLIPYFPQLLMTVLLKSFLLAILCLFLIKIFTHFGGYTWFENQGYVLEYVVLGCMLLLLIADMMYEKWQDKKHNTKRIYQCGVDTLTDYKHDAIGGSYIYKQCPQCQSYRMTDLYFYKKALAKNQSQLPSITVDESQFVGCLNCCEGFQVLSSAQYSKTGTLLFLSLGIFGVVLFLLYHEVVVLLVADSSIRHTIGSGFGLWFYMFILVMSGYSTDYKAKENLKKLDF